MRFTTLQNLADACNETIEGSVYVPTGKFLESLTCHEKLTHAVQWLFRNRSFCALTDRIQELLKVDEIKSFNTYNWGGNCTNDLQGFDFTYKGNDYCALQIHRGGDIRSNYSDLVVVEGSFIDNVQEFYADSVSIEVDGHDIAATPSITSEYIELYDRTDGVELESVTDVDIEDIKEDIREQLKKAA